MTSNSGSFHQTKLWDFKCLTGLAVASSIFNFAYVLHLNIVPLYLELERPTPVRMRRVIRLTIVVTTTIYFIVGYAGLMLYGEDTKSNILLNFSAEPIYVMAKGAVCVAVTLAFPLLFFPMRITLHNLGTNLFNLSPVDPKVLTKLKTQNLKTQILIVVTALTLIGSPGHSKTRNSSIHACRFLISSGGP